jgi:hyperosmotically inducible periplasmic protein
MPMHRSLRAALLGLIMVLGTTLVMPAAAPTSAVEAIRNELLKLPYYSVFDYLAFSYDKGTVTLMGYAYRPSLKEDAVRAVKRAPGVDQVVDKIEVLPVSPNDDEIRWKTYYAIYRDPFLSKYAPGGGMLWGHRHALGGAGLRSFAGGMFPGMEPAGDYPIHIIVKNGRITLLGVVDNETDKMVAEIRARGVSGAFGVDNQLIVEKTSNATR